MRILVSVAAVATVGFLALHPLQRSSRLQAPRSLGSMTLVDENPPELGQTRSMLSSRGLHDVLLAVYAPPGVPVVAGQSGFTLLAAHTDQAAVDMRQAVLAAASVSRGLITPLTENLAGSDYACGTVRDARGEATTCFWQGRHAVLLGIGYGIDGTETITLTAFARIDLGFAD